MSDASIVEYFAEHEHYRCGYCGSPDTNSSHGMWAHTMTTEDYQDLIDRGWRRSGKYCYKPTMNVTCCPQYAIRCQVADFKLTRSQKKVIRRVNKYLNTGERTVSGESDDRGGAMETAPNKTATVGVGVAKDGAKGKITEGKLGCDVKASSAAGIAAVESNSQDKVTATQSKGNVPRSEPRKTPRPGNGPDPQKPQCKKAKELRLERWRQKQTLKTGDSGEVKEVMQGKHVGIEPKSLEDYLNDISRTPAHKLEIKLVRSNPKSIPFEARFAESYAIYKKYQMAIHGDPPDKPSQSQFTRFLVDSPLQIRLIRSSPPNADFKSSFQESFAVYHKYQMSIHKDAPDDCDEEAFRNFLVDSPLEPMYREGGFESGFGSFHQHYVLDGQLIGVGVLDILPYCVSSVYLYYDPAFSFLSLGTYSALREVAFTRQLRTLEPSIEQYYMGFYIHSCPKMKYKGKLSASYLLCPESYTWHPHEKCAPKLDASQYSRFASPDVVDEDSKIDMQYVLVLTMRQKMPYFIYRSLRPDKGDEAEVRSTQALWGEHVHRGCCSTGLDPDT